MNLYYKLFLYCLPFFYLVKSRLKKIELIFSWIYIFYFINLLTVYVFNKEIDFINYNLLFIILIANYEIGYLFNDFVTSKKEKNPTVRISAIESEFILKNFNIIIFLKLIVLIILIIQFLEVLTFKFIITFIFLNFFFVLHNIFRGWQNIYTFFLLHHIKNLLITIPFVDEFILLNFLIFINSSLNRFLENLSLPRFNLKFFRSSIIYTNRHKFRFLYFSFVIFILIIILFFIDKLSLIFPTIFILVFRAFIFYIYKNE